MQLTESDKSDIFAKSYATGICLPLSAFLVPRGNRRIISNRPKKERMKALLPIVFHFEERQARNLRCTLGSGAGTVLGVTALVLFLTGFAGAGRRWWNLVAVRRRPRDFSDRPRARHFPMAVMG